MQTASAPMSAAQKAWATRRARAAALAAAVMPLVSPAQAERLAPIAKPAVVNVSTGATIKTSLYVRPVLEPVDELQVVDIWLDHRDVGCGTRRYVVLAKSSIEVQLFYTPRPLTITIPRQTFDDQHVPARKCKPALIADLIRKRLALVDHVNTQAQSEELPDGGRDTTRALELLAIPRRRH